MLGALGNLTPEAFLDGRFRAGWGRPGGHDR